jgi:transposase-like protein
MRLQMLLPPVKPLAPPPPTHCPTPGCPGTTFTFHQAVPKPLRDTRYHHVVAHRYECTICHHVQRVYPPGVSGAQTSDRVKGLAVMLYLLGLSYGGVADALAALGVDFSKTSCYRAVQEAAAALPDLRRDAVFGARRTRVLGADLTSVLCNGQWLTLGRAVDDLSGVVLSVDILDSSDTASIREWLSPIAAAVGAEVLVTDDADSFKTVADDLGLAQQVCKKHVVRNTDALVDELAGAIVGDPDGSLGECGVSEAAAAADLARLRELIHTRPVGADEELYRRHLQYKGARPAREGEKASVAYRLRLLFLDRAKLWPRLTRYRQWEGLGGERMDGTNNGSERGIGWGIKERYWPMRGYKVATNAERVSRLLCWAGNAQRVGKKARLGQVVGTAA